MQYNESITDIKNGLEPFIGHRIKLRANKGRKKIIERDGVLESTYPNLFTVRLDEAPTRRVSYNYSDILTQNIQLQIL